MRLDVVPSKAEINKIDTNQANGEKNNDNIPTT